MLVLVSQYVLTFIEFFPLYVGARLLRSRLGGFIYSPLLETASEDGLGGPFSLLSFPAAMLFTIAAK